MGKIGIFDSGYGGLSIMRDVVRSLPQYDYIYLGDSARTPYGPKTTEEVRQYTVQAVDFLFTAGCELIILACNTASAQALRYIQQQHLPLVWPNKRILGVLIPAAETAAEITENNRIGIMATIGTVQAGSFVDEIKKLKNEVKIFQQACPKLVELVEAGEVHDQPLVDAITEYVTPLLHQNVDTIILGCTHYELIQPTITELVPKTINIVAEGAVVADKLVDYLHRHPEIEQKLTQTKDRSFYTTGDIDTFIRLGSYFYDQLLTAEKIELQKK
ncbi:MAG TPA: glutamate racemase [Candidatus Saccharimonadales bacterium]|jgi:glutamate racemase|nr:glutamate racemase [Candidatus Saccharimonadales bacterium]